MMFFPITLDWQHCILIFPPTHESWTPSPGFLHPYHTHGEDASTHIWTNWALGRFFFLGGGVCSVPQKPSCRRCFLFSIRFPLARIVHPVSRYDFGDCAYVRFMLAGWLKLSTYLGRWGLLEQKMPTSNCVSQGCFEAEFTLHSFSFLPTELNSPRAFSPIHMKNNIYIHIGKIWALGHYLSVLFHKSHLAAVSVLAGARSVGGENANTQPPPPHGFFEARLVHGAWTDLQNFWCWSRKPLEAKYCLYQ